MLLISILEQTEKVKEIKNVSLAAYSFEPIWSYSVLCKINVVMNFPSVICYLTYLLHMHALKTADIIFCWRLQCAFVMQGMILRYFQFLL